MDKIINFIGVGAVKSGTSWLSNILDQHPEIEFSTRKEISYFNKYDFKGLKNISYNFPLNFYFKFWSDKKKIKGEFSPQYLFDSHAPSKIKNTFPDVKILIILRNPLEVLYSHYHYEKYFNQTIPEKMSFKESIKKYKFLLNSVKFSKQIKRYQNLFHKSQIKIYIFEEAIMNPREFSKKLYMDLGLINVDFLPDFKVINKSKKVRFKFINKFFNILSAIKNILTRSHSNFFFNFMKSKLYLYIVRFRDKILTINVVNNKKHSLSDNNIKFIENYLKNEILEIEKLLGKDLTIWRKYD
tara:strand:- start:2692 stop:3585 length:894 start_codon:yes stop_codon:yes gene_type:complete